jgi:mono/diheme cytochrome c family protein
MVKVTGRALRTLGIAGALLTAGACTPLDDAMANIFGRSMRDQSSFDPYEDPLRAPEGSVPFAAGNFPAAPGEVNVGQPEGLGEVLPPFTPFDLFDEAEVVVGLRNPVPPDGASLDRGEEMFLRFCAPCHGADGAGPGYVYPAGMPAYPLISDRVKGFTDGYIYGMIRVGRGLMPAYGDRISHFDRWNIVNYLRVLQGVVPTTAQDEGPGDQTGGGSAEPGGTSSN